MGARAIGRLFPSALRFDAVEKRGFSVLSQSIVSDDAAFDARRSGSTEASALFYPLR
jgi:hypothetical protein